MNPSRARLEAFIARAGASVPAGARGHACSAGARVLDAGAGAAVAVRR